MSQNKFFHFIRSLMGRTRKISAKRAALEQLRVNLMVGDGLGNGGPDVKESLRQLMSSMVLALHKRGRPRRVPNGDLINEI